MQKRPIFLVLMNSSRRVSVSSVSHYFLQLGRDVTTLYGTWSYFVSRYEILIISYNVINGHILMNDFRTKVKGAVNETEKVSRPLLGTHPFFSSVFILISATHLL